MILMEQEMWAYVKVKCSDGITRLGINMVDESEPAYIIEGGFHYDDVCANVESKAKELNMEVYDNCNPDYDGII
jgi:hypothetical protein